MIKSAHFNNDNTMLFTATNNEFAQIWGYYTNWTIDQLLCYRLLSAWLLVQKPKKTTESIQEFIKNTSFYDDFNEDYILDIYNTFELPAQKALWEKIKTFIQKYGK